MSELVAAARLSQAVGPFTLRRLLLRARVFSDGPFTADEIRRALPEIESELRDMLKPGDLSQALSALGQLVDRDQSARSA